MMPPSITYGRRIVHTLRRSLRIYRNCAITAVCAPAAQFDDLRDFTLRELRNTHSLRNCGAVLLTAGFYILNTAETAGTARYPQFAKLRRSFINCGILHS